MKVLIEDQDGSVKERDGFGWASEPISVYIDELGQRKVFAVTSTDTKGRQVFSFKYSNPLPK